MIRLYSIVIFSAMILLTAGCKKSEMEKKKMSDLEAKINRFAPVAITADTTKLSDGDKKALVKLFAASKIMDQIYTRQVWKGNEALREKLEADTSPEGTLRLQVLQHQHEPLVRPRSQ